MSIKIPYGSMGFLDEMNAVPKFATCTFGVSSGNPDVECDDCGTFTLFEVPDSIIILDAKTCILEAFTANVDVNIGDSDVTNGLVAEAAACATTASSVMKRSEVANGYFDATGKKGGVFYEAGNDINLIISGATPAAGKGMVVVQYLLV